MKVTIRNLPRNPAPKTKALLAFCRRAGIQVKRVRLPRRPMR